MVMAYWFYDNDKNITEREGNIDNNGDFKFAGAFGINTRFKGYYFLSKEDAIADKLSDLNNEINEANGKYHDFVKRYKIVIDKF